MYCAYCQKTRSENAAPCPHCGAPSPLAGTVGATNAEGQSFGDMVRGNPQSWSPPAQNQASGQPISQQSWDNQQYFWSVGDSEQNTQTAQPSQQGWNQQQFSPAGQPSQQGWSPQQLSPAGQPSQQGWNLQQLSPSQQGWSSQQLSQAAQPSQQGWNSQQMSQAGQPQGTEQQQQWSFPTQAQQTPPQTALVPYQNGAELQPTSRTSMLQLIPSEVAEKMLPAIPEEEMAVYVPPMYTKPRPIIPTYRAISGFLSVIIVSLLLCTGAGYAAKATGTLDTLTRFVTGETHPTPLATAVPQALQDPKTLLETGPAYNANGPISSATTTSRVNENSIAMVPEHAFKVNQVIHVTYSVKSAQAGTVQVQWFSNGHPMIAAILQKFDPKDGQNKHADASISYTLSAQGYVELRWNGQLAARLYFVVRPA